MLMNNLLILIAIKMVNSFDDGLDYDDGQTSDGQQNGHNNVGQKNYGHDYIKSEIIDLIRDKSGDIFTMSSFDCNINNITCDFNGRRAQIITPVNHCKCQCHDQSPIFRDDIKQCVNQDHGFLGKQKSKNFFCFLNLNLLFRC